MADEELQIVNLMNEINILRDAIVGHGCGGHWTTNGYDKEYECDHGYPWTCEECPCQKEPKP